MYKTIDFRLRGIRPALQHNGQLANPFNSWARQLKKITSKRTKTDEDLELMAELEFKGSLYLADEEKGDTVVWPGVNVEAMIRSGAKKTNQGKLVQAGVMVQKDFPLIYDGPKARDKLWADGRFTFITNARVGGRSGGTVQRCRPRFDDWAFEFTAHYLPDVINAEDLVRAVRTAGL